MVRCWRTNKKAGLTGGNWLISTSGSKTVTTWTVGGGLEWAFAQSWSVKGEYMFIGLNDGSGFQTCGPVTTPSGAILAGGPFCFATASTASTPPRWA